jgi:hypothetical protein
MTEMLDQVRRVGWLIAEAGLLVVILCILLNIILGAESSGEFVAAVAKNANAFLQSLPAGTMMGLALLVVAYWLLKQRLAR